MIQSFLLLIPFILFSSMGTFPTADASDSAAGASGKSPHIIHIVPQSHIDVVWLWRYDPETIHRCCKMTFTQALINLDRFPEYTFAQSQVPLYEPLETIYPKLFQRIKEYIRQGRWEIVGGMYVEAEGGEPCGESFVRQCVMGKRWFQQKFGVDVTNGWQADAWSHLSQLPQILVKSGMDSYLWRRGNAGGPRNHVTEKLFWWEAPDGSKVLAVRFPDLEKPPYPEWKEDVRSSQEQYGLNDTLIVIGWGDHGGGPTEKDIQTTLDFARQRTPQYQVQFSTFKKYVEAVLSQHPKLPTVQGDLGQELQADLTNVGEIKKSNRECENLLLSSEKWASIAAVWFGYEYPQEELEEAWKKLLFNQFHDILGGSLIPEAVADAMRLYRSIRETCEYTQQQTLSTIACSIHTDRAGIPIVVFNPLSWKRTDVVECRLELAHLPKHLMIQDEQGHRFPLQIVERSKSDEGKDRLQCVFLAENVPSLGYKTYYAAASEENSVPGFLHATENQLENEFFLLEVDPQTGGVRRIFDKKNNREVLDQSRQGNLLVAIEDEGDSEGRFNLKSDIADKPLGKAVNLDSDCVLQLVESGPVRAKLRVERKYQNSRFTQDVILYPGVARIDFDLRIDWHDIHRMIKAAFPLALNNPEATYDVPYAAMVRPTDGNEYPAQKWVELFADDYGVSFINNGRSAYDVQGNTVRLSILRSPTHPAYNTDEGVHTLTYALYPHKNHWEKAGVMQRGYEINYPLQPFITTRHSGDLPSEKSFISVQPENVILEVIKPAYDSGQTVLRLFELYGQDSVARVTFPAPVQSAQETDLLEKNPSAIPVAGTSLEFLIRRHEIKTIQVKWTE